MKIGILGYGSIGTRHALNIEFLGHEFVAYDPSVSRPSYRDYVFTNADAIVIATPSKIHAHDLMDVLHAGKHVLVEKPIGYDCPPLIDGFLQGIRYKDRSLIIATGFNLRFHHCVQKTKELLPSIGNILAASFTVYQKTTKPPYLMDGIVRNWLSHEIDLAHYLLGEGDVVSASVPVDSNGNDTTDAFVEMKFPKVKGNVYLQADYYSDPEQRYFWIEGEKGSIYVNLVLREIYMRMGGGPPHMAFQASDTWDDNYIDEMKCFLDSIQQGRHLEPLATGEDGVRALYTVMAIRAKAGI